MRLLLMLAMLIALTSYGQTITFREASYPNGMRYPIIGYSDKQVELAINRDLEKQVEKYKSMDFCMGQFGYVQKTKYVQIHIYANCIDLDASENIYQLYNLENGENVPLSNMLNEEVLDEFTVFITNKVKAHMTSQSLTLNEEEIKAISFDDFTAEFTKDGMFLISKSISNWDKKMKITWNELQTYLRFTWI